MQYLTKGKHLICDNRSLNFFLQSTTTTNNKKRLPLLVNSPNMPDVVFFF